MNRGGKDERYIFDLNATRNFYHIWSLLSLSFGLSGHEENHNVLVPDTDLVSDDAQFGHGVFVAGAVLIHFLGQVELFYACDFSSQLSRIKALEVSSPLQITQGAFSTVQFVKTKSNHAKVYNMFFSLLRVHAMRQLMITICIFCLRLLMIYYAGYPTST